MSSGFRGQTLYSADGPPTRASNRTRSASGGSVETLLPTLEEGLTLLDVDDRAASAVQALVVDHLLFDDGHAGWVDAAGYATTTSMARMAPSERLLDRIHVARGFTAYQHYAAVNGLATAVYDGADGTGRSCSLLVAPAVDAPYRDEESLYDETTAQLFVRTLARLRSYGGRYDVPVLLTRRTVDEFTAPMEAAADHHLHCEQTEFGPRFVGDDVETTAYPVGDGTCLQTTFAYWRELLAVRARRAQSANSDTGRPAEETSQPRVRGSARPASLADAWIASGGR